MDNRQLPNYRPSRSVMLVSVTLLLGAFVLIVLGELLVVAPLTNKNAAWELLTLLAGCALYATVQFWWIFKRNRLPTIDG